MSEWENEKFQVLLTPTIWVSNYEEINKILKIPEWNDKKFQSLLTSTIWKNNYDTVIVKLNLPYWQESKYQHLLVPSIFSIIVSNIENGIALLKEYVIDQYITNKCLRLKTTTLKQLIEYMIDNDINLVIVDDDGNYKLNPILSCEKGQLKRKYNIDINEI